MLRKQTALLSSIRYFYNNRNNWQRYNKNIPLETEELVLKKEFKVGDKAQFIYKNNIIFPKQYKPWHEDIQPMFVLGGVIFLFFLNWRYQKKRQLAGKTYTTEYKI